MAEEETKPSPRTRAASRIDSVRYREAVPDFDKPLPGNKDRKSLAGMSDSVKAILAPLLGGKRSHSKVEVDLGKESSYSGDASFETVPTGSTAMHRYSIDEGSKSPTAEASNPSGKVFGDTGTAVDAITPKATSPRASDVFGPETRGSGSPMDPAHARVKGKYEEDEPRTGSPIDEAYARVENFVPATKPKMKEYDEYIKETAPRLRARVNSILSDRSHEAGFERRLPGGEELPKLKDVRPIYGDASEMPQPTADSEPSLMEKVKDSVTGQVPGHGIFSGKATIEDNRVPSAVTGRLPVQDVGMGSNVHAGTAGGRFDRDRDREPGKEESGVPGRNPNEEHEGDDNMDAVERLRETVAVAKNSLKGNEEAEHAVVAGPQGGLPRHPRSTMAAANNPQGAPEAPVRGGTIP